MASTSSIKRLKPFASSSLPPEESDALRGPCGTTRIALRPLATQPEDALRVVEAEIANGRQLVSVGLMRRFDPFHAAVREIAA